MNGDWCAMTGQNIPSIVTEAFLVLKQHVTPQSHVFEWGSGRSTIWFNLVTQHVITIEHDKKWYRRILAELKHMGLSPERLSWIPQGKRGKGYTSRRTPGVFDRYVRAIEEYPNDHFNVVMVDGRCRLKCVEAAMPKVKRGEIGRAVV